MPKMPTIAMLAVLAGCAAPPARPPPTRQADGALSAWSVCTISNASKLALNSRESAEAVATAALVRCSETKLAFVKELEVTDGAQVAREAAEAFQKDIFYPSLLEQVVTARAQRGL